MDLIGWLLRRVLCMLVLVWIHVVSALFVRREMMRMNECVVFLFFFI
jgi:hypothetical protein